MNDMTKPPRQRLDFAPEVTVTKLEQAGLFKIRREVEGRPREMVLAPIEALLCSLLERGQDPRHYLGDTAVAKTGMQDRAARLNTALRAFLQPEHSDVHELPKSPAFEGPDVYMQAWRNAPANEHFLLRDIAPQELVWYVTHRCPRRCRYCHWVQKGRSDIESDSLPLKRAVGLMLEAWLGGVQRLVMTGGEPMLRRDLLKIIESGSRLGLPIWLFTRYHITPKRAADLAEAGVSRIFFSLDTLDSDANNQLVENAAVVAEARRSLSAMVNAGLDVTLVPVLTALNAETLTELAEDMAEIGVSSMRPIAYKGRASAKFNDLFALSQADKDAIRESLAAVRQTISLDLTTLYLDTKTAICESGITTIYVQPNGSVSYCPLTQGTSGAPFGRLPEDTLDALWQNRRLGRLLAGNGLALAGPRSVARITDTSSCVLRKERLDLK